MHKRPTEAKSQVATDDQIAAVSSGAAETDREVKCSHYEYGYVDSADADCKPVCEELTEGSFRIVCEREAKVVNRCKEMEYNWATHKVEVVPQDPLCSGKKEVYACKTCARFLRDQSRDFLHDNLQNGIEAAASMTTLSLGVILLFILLI